MFLNEEKEFFNKAKSFGTVAVAGVGSIQSYVNQLIKMIAFERNRCANLIKSKRNIKRERDNLKVLLKRVDKWMGDWHCDDPRSLRNNIKIILGDL